MENKTELKRTSGIQGRELDLQPVQEAKNRQMTRKTMIMRKKKAEKERKNNESMNSRDTRSGYVTMKTITRNNKNKGKQNKQDSDTGK